MKLTEAKEDLKKAEEELEKLATDTDDGTESG